MALQVSEQRTQIIGDGGFFDFSKVGIKP